MQTNPYYISNYGDYKQLRRPASQDFQAPVNFQMPNQPGGPPQQGGGQQGGFGQWFQGQDKMQGITAGLQAGASNANPEGDFSVDPYAGFKGSGQGLMSGGPIGAIVGGITAQAGQFSKINKNLKNLQTGVEGTTYDEYGRPVYAGENIANANANINELDKGEKALKFKGDPATQMFAKVFGTKKKIRRKRGALQRGIQQAQAGFNEADVTARNQANAMEDYFERLNPQGRMNNLYRTQY